MKDELNGQMARLREECANRVAELEKQLDSAHGNRMSSMFQMKEEVNLELTNLLTSLKSLIPTKYFSVKTLQNTIY